MTIDNIKSIKDSIQLGESLITKLNDKIDALTSIKNKIKDSNIDLYQRLDSLE